MPSIYLKKAYLPDTFEVVMPFGTFTVGREQKEADIESDSQDDREFSYCGTTITRSQYRAILAERDRVVEIAAIKVRAANAARDAAITDRLENAPQRRQAAEQARLKAARTKLESRLAWATGELTRLRLVIVKATADIERMEAVRDSAQAELGESAQ